MGRAAFEVEYKLLFNLERDFVPGLASMSNEELVHRVLFVRKLMDRVSPAARPGWDVK
jgi:hypothetical protein